MQSLSSLGFLFLCFFLLCQLSFFAALLKLLIFMMCYDTHVMYALLFQPLKKKDNFLCSCSFKWKSNPGHTQGQLLCEACEWGWLEWREGGERLSSPEQQASTPLLLGQWLQAAIKNSKWIKLMPFVKLVTFGKKQTLRFQWGLK